MSSPGKRKLSQQDEESDAGSVSSPTSKKGDTDKNSAEVLSVSTQPGTATPTPVTLVNASVDSSVSPTTTLPNVQPHPLSGPHVVSVVPAYYPVYPSSYFVSLPRPPTGPTITTNAMAANATTATSTIGQPKILPKPEGGAICSTSPTATSAPHTIAPFIHPFSIQISPPLHPAAVTYHPGHGTADQREHARRVSHSAIERRRRERINDKIAQLKQLIPSCAHQDNLHKMSILQSAIDYIVYLKTCIDEAGLDKDDQTPLVARRPPVRQTGTRDTTQAEDEAWSTGTTPISSPLLSPATRGKFPRTEGMPRPSSSSTLGSPTCPPSPSLAQGDQTRRQADGSLASHPTPADSGPPCNSSTSSVSPSHETSAPAQQPLPGCILPPPLLPPIITSTPQNAISSSDKTPDTASADQSSNMSLHNLLC